MKEFLKKLGRLHLGCYIVVAFPCLLEVLLLYVTSSDMDSFSGDVKIFRIMLFASVEMVIIPTAIVGSVSDWWRDRKMTIKEF